MQWAQLSLCHQLSLCFVLLRVLLSSWSELKLSDILITESTEGILIHSGTFSSSSPRGTFQTGLFQLQFRFLQHRKS